MVTRAMIFLIGVLAVAGAWATNDPDTEQSQDQQQQQQQTAVSEAKNVNEVAAAGGSVSNSFNHEAGAPDVILVPNNNTASCHKVFGLALSNRDGGGGIGFPYRDRDCDYDQAADDAAATGDHSLAWYWRCHKKNLYKSFRDNGESKQQAIADCHDRMLAGRTDELKSKITQLEDQKRRLLAERAADRDELGRQRAACERQIEAIDDRCTK